MDADLKYDAMFDYAAENAPKVFCPYCKRQYSILSGEGEYDCECGRVFYVQFVFDKKGNFIGANVRKNAPGGKNV